MLMIRRVRSFFIFLRDIIVDNIQEEVKHYCHSILVCPHYDWKVLAIIRSHI